MQFNLLLNLIFGKRIKDETMNKVTTIKQNVNIPGRDVVPNLLHKFSNYFVFNVEQHADSQQNPKKIKN